MVLNKKKRYSIFGDLYFKCVTQKSNSSCDWRNKVITLSHKMSCKQNHGNYSVFIGPLSTNDILILWPMQLFLLLTRGFCTIMSYCRIICKSHEICYGFDYTVFSLKNYWNIVFVFTTKMQTWDERGHILVSGALV